MGDVWARRSQADSEGPSTWAVFRGGELLGDVEVPEGVTVLSIEGPRLVGRWRDDLGVEHVRVYALLPP